MFLKLRPHRQQSVASRINSKLAARYYGPFQIVEKIGAMAYKLKLPNGSRVHPVFHVSLLKREIGDYAVDNELPQEIEGGCVEQFVPEGVLATRVNGLGEQIIKPVLIRWTNRAVDEATWEDIETITNQFPEFNLEDKVVFLEGVLLGTKGMKMGQILK